MTTPRIRSLVSFVAALTFTLTVGGCASAPARLAVNADEQPLTFRFDNEARDYVHVYLIGTRQEWLLGRVEPGARATLRIPDEAVAEDLGSMRLAVRTGERVTLRAATEARTVTTILQPAAELLSMRWTFSQTSASGAQLTPHAIVGPRALVGRQ
jgi:hypothetical protein